MICKLLKCFLLTTLVVVLTSCRDDDDLKNEEKQIVPLSIIGEATKNGFHQFVIALKHSGLDKSLKTEEIYTVFAPTDNAFKTLLATNDSWKSIIDIPSNVLKEILQNHVIEGSKISWLSLFSKYHTTANKNSKSNFSLYFSFVTEVENVIINGGATTIAGANVIMLDVEASNGVLYGIDKVLSAPSILDFISIDLDLGLFRSRLKEADFKKGRNWALELGDTSQKFTVFAPTTNAFIDHYSEKSKLSDDKEYEPTPLESSDLIRLHTVDGELYKETFISKEITTVGSKKIILDTKKSTLTDPTKQTSKVNENTIIKASNGVIYFIDRVLESK